MDLRPYKDKEEHDILYLDLKKTGDVVKLVILDSDGSENIEGSILTVGLGGIVLYDNINTKFGLPLDSEGHLKVSIVDGSELKQLRFIR